MKEFKENLEKVVDESLSRAIKNVPSLIKGSVRNIVFAAIGCEHSFGKVKVDHCNGRNPMIAQFIDESAKRVAKREIDNILTDEFVSEMMQELRDPVIEEFRERVRRAFRMSMESKIEEAVEAEATKAVDVIRKQVIMIEAEQLMSAQNMTKTQEAALELEIENSLEAPDDSS
jgi:hypothetical protein